MARYAGGGGETVDEVGGDVISKETMRVVLTAMKMLLDRRELCVTSLEWRIKMCADTAEHGKSAGARTRAQGEITKLRKELENGNKLAQEVRDAINELRATEVGAEVSMELKAA